MTLTFEAACAALLARSPTTIDWSLRPTQQLLEVLGHPERHFPAIHVGGTNGKGSVCHLIYAALRDAGFRTGLYTSPHLVNVRERFVVNDRPVPEAAFAEWAKVVLPAAEQANASFFEATTAIAFADFAARSVDIAVVEVGLGGRLDSTNVLMPAVSAVVQVAKDHTDYLGESLAGIAREKAGIAKPGRPFIIGETAPDLVAVMSDVAVSAGAIPVVVPAGLGYPGELSLLGPHQRRNAATAQAILEALPGEFQVTPESVQRGFAAAFVPGRLDRRGKWIFDVAHNPNGMEALAVALGTLAPARPVHVLAGILGDKDWRAMLRTVAGIADRVWLTDPPSAPASRRWSLAEVAAESGARFSAEPQFDVALRDVQHGAGTVLVTGSFHTVGDAMARLPGFAPLG